MSKELIEQIEQYLKNDDMYILFRAILDEVAYQYNDIKLNYDDFKSIDLNLDDFEEITKNIMSTYYMNEGLNEVISDYLYDYIDNNGGK